MNLNIALLVFLAGSAIAASACGGRDDTDRLIEKLPSLVTTKEEVEGAFSEQRGWFASTDQSEASPNELAAQVGPSLYARRDADSLEDAGRVVGYVVTHSVGEPEGRDNPRFPRVAVGVSVNLYRDDQWAQAAISTRPFSATGHEIPIDSIGDSAVAWPQRGGGVGAQFNENAGCACVVVFRVGPLVGTVFIARQGGGPRPSTTQEVDQNSIEFAKAMAERFRAALAE